MKASRTAREREREERIILLATCDFPSFVFHSSQNEKKSSLHPLSPLHPGSPPPELSCASASAAAAPLVSSFSLEDDEDEREREEIASRKAAADVWEEGGRKREEKERDRGFPQEACFCLPEIFCSRNPAASAAAADAVVVFE